MFRMFFVEFHSDAPLVYHVEHHNIRTTVKIQRKWLFPYKTVFFEHSFSLKSKRRNVIVSMVYIYIEEGGDRDE